MDSYNGADIRNEGGPFLGIAVLLHFIPAVAITVRRLHDVNKSGWWVLLTMIPGLGFILLIAFGAEPSTLGENRYGKPDSSNLDSKSERLSVPPSGKIRYLEKLEKLATLRYSETITEGEFQSLKAKIMDGES